MIFSYVKELISKSGNKDCHCDSALFLLPCLFLLLLTVSVQTDRTYALDEDKSSLYETGLLHRINQYRTENGMNTLSLDRTLNRLARTHSRYMDKKNILCHDNFEARFRECGRSYCVENVGWNSSDTRGSTTGMGKFKGTQCKSPEQEDKIRRHCKGRRLCNVLRL